ncbi:unnamed protein product [Clonostachys rosea]|uniref:Calcineurin-like phosphoesterase domain-containing protein n=1 Tax=Bionectria ochroleuca TaxID=29856 RepID=A0ABY6TUW1_BIOOC|nr:unnamed protein product [Clonostachys rosea]
MGDSAVNCRFLILSDTHGEDLPLQFDFNDSSIDVLIHCGDLTTESKLHEFRKTLQMIDNIKASLKLVIPGNHDFTLDKASYTALLDREHLEKALVEKIYGKYGRVGEIFADYQDIHLLDEGMHTFGLPNGANFKVFASPFTPSESNMGFHYPPGDKYTWEIGETDVVITHGPPEGILDRTISRTRAGCPQLFAAIARQRPRLHCFGHIHEGWGAKLVTWRENVSKEPSHFTDIDNGKSTTIATLASLNQALYGDRQDGEGDSKQPKLKRLQGGGVHTSCCTVDECCIEKGAKIYL